MLVITMKAHTLSLSVHTLHVLLPSPSPSPHPPHPQPYRHVDNIMFEDGKIVNRFIEGWRASGQQRIGYLYGRYIPLESEVPLGIRAEVAAIYEPPQV